MKSGTRKLFAVIQIALQLLPSSSVLYLSPVFNASAQEKISSPEKVSAKNSDQGADSIAQTAVQAGSLLSSDNASDALVSTVVNAATGKAASSVQEWLSQFGTARVNISTDELFTLNDSDLDLLLPLYNGKENLLFTQLGGRRHDDRNIVNGGFGYRHFNDNWMWGTNIFYDRQVSGNEHQRLGFGTELGWDYLKLSANGYLRLSDWMSSSRYEDYDERVANGFDIRATGYLPAYPQLGANIIYEQYFGDSVGLFGDDEDDRQKDPYAVTVGVNYTPVPLVTMGLNQKMGKSGENDTQVNLALTWTPGVPLSAQLDPSQVAQRRTLQGGRMDLVDRNNNIVLEYRKQELISLSLPPELEGAEQSKQAVTAKVKAKHGLDRIEWRGDSFFSHGGKITAGSSPEQVVMTLPVWQGSGSNSYTLSATAWDKKGNASSPERINVTVNGIDVNTLQSTTTVSSAKVPADGKSTAVVSVTLKTSAGEAATGLASRLTATLTSSVTAAAKAAGAITDKAPTIGAFTESGSGIYTATLISGTTPDTLTIQPLIDGTITLATATLIEEATVVLPQLTTLDTSANSALASGSAPITLTAHVTDQYGKVLKDAVVNWSADSAQAVLSASQTSTDETGAAQIQVSSKDVITTVVTAQLQGGNALSSPSLTFTADMSTAKVVAIDSEKDRVVANNTDTSVVTAQVTDGYSHPVSGVTVNWTVKMDDTAVATKTSTTDSSGNAVLSLKSSKTGTITVNAEVNGTTQETNPITFVADTSTVVISQITPDKQQGVANGTDSITYQATVTDAKGNAIAGATVNWSADNRDVKLSAAQTTSAADGTSQITITSVKAGDVVVTVQTSEATPKAANKVTFVADAATAKVTGIQADKTQAVADGADVITWTATVTDANDNVVTGTTLNWSTTQDGVTLTPASSDTDVNGTATTAGTSVKAGMAVKVTATPATNTSGEKTDGAVTFIGDVKTATVASLTPSSTHVSINGSGVTYTAVVTDANGNPLQGETVTWTTSINTLSATESTTNSSGKTSVTLRGATRGPVTVTATAGGTTLEDRSVDFFDTVSYDWSVTGASGQYKGDVITDYNSVGFIATGDTVGPTSLYKSGRSGQPATTLTVPMRDENGVVHSVVFKGVRQTEGCATMPFNDATVCESLRNKPQLNYYASDNPSLPKGVYEGVITFDGQDYNTQARLLSYHLNTLLTVE
jgi:adhesin/invasin